MSRTSKTDVRLLAYADVDEANAAIGVALAAGELPEDVGPRCCAVQNDLFDVGADLCTPVQPTYEYPPLRVEQAWIDELEADCDRYIEPLEKLRSFILPGGTVGSAPPARGRARWCAAPSARPGRPSTRYGDQPGTGTKGEGGVNVAHRDRTSTGSRTCCSCSRAVANLPIGGDVLWQPGGGRAEAPATTKA